MPCGIAAAGSAASGLASFRPCIQRKLATPRESNAATDKVQTPDLRGFSGTTPVLCEVKTINVRDDEANRLATGGVRTTLRYLEQPFLNKLSATIRKAATQLLAFNKDLTSRRIVYVIFNFDDRIHEYADEYQKQIETFLVCDHRGFRSHRLNPTEQLFELSLNFGDGRASQ